MTVDLDYEFTGRDNGPVLVLSHSLGADRTMWTPQLAQFRSHFRVLLVDTRGHGASPALPGPYRIEDLGQDFLALFDRLELRQVSWCGLSLGGMIGMWLAGNYPSYVDRLALCCTAPVLPPPQNWTSRAAAVRRAESTAGLISATLERWFGSCYRQRSRELVADFASVFAATDPEGYAGCCEAIAGMDLRADLARITAPTLALSGQDDPVTPPAALSEVARLAGGDFVTVPGRHLATVESPVSSTRALLNHLVISEET